MNFRIISVNLRPREEGEMVNQATIAREVVDNEVGLNRRSVHYVHKDLIINVSSFSDGHV